MQESRVVRKRKAIKAEPLEAPKKLSILVTIVERSKAEFYLDVLEGYEVNLQTVIYGRGTAPSEMIHYLGLSQDSKAVLFNVVQEEKVKEIMKDYEEQYFKTKHGKGIAFTIPISSIIGVYIYRFLSNQREGLEA